MKDILKLHPTLNFKAKRESKVNKLNVENESKKKKKKRKKKMKALHKTLRKQSNAKMQNHF